MQNVKEYQTWIQIHIPWQIYVLQIAKDMKKGKVILQLPP